MVGNDGTVRFRNPASAKYFDFDFDQVTTEVNLFSYVRKVDVPSTC